MVPPMYSDLACRTMSYQTDQSLSFVTDHNVSNSIIYYTTVAVFSGRVACSCSDMLLMQMDSDCCLRPTYLSAQVMETFVHV